MNGYKIIKMISGRNLGNPEGDCSMVRVLNMARLENLRWVVTGDKDWDSRKIVRMGSHSFIHSGYLYRVT